MQKTDEKKFPLGKFLKWIFLGLLVIGTVMAFVFHEEVFGEGSVFNKDIASNAVVNTLFQKIPALIRSVQIITIAYVLSVLVRGGLKLFLARSNRGATIVTLVNSFIKYAVAIVAFLMVLSAWGVDTGTLLASAGILGLVIGLGAESLIADIIAGIFIVFEGEYQVGDIIVVDDWRGTVEEIGIRTTGSSIRAETKRSSTTTICVRSSTRRRNSPLRSASSASNTATASNGSKS